jgi:hypothetical protein
MLGITITDESFHEAAVDGVDIEIDVGELVVRVGEQEWSFKLSPMEKELSDAGGMTSAFWKFGKRLFEVMCVPKGEGMKSNSMTDNSCSSIGELQW